MSSTKPTSNEAENGNKSKPLLSSRLFKFRAWDEKQKYMAIQGTPDLETLQSFIFHFGEDILMQFTGFKDKSGNEIYEGDIVFNHAENGVCNSNIIIFNEYGYFLQTYFSETRREIISLNEYLTRDLEVIGNIFQNPELLQAVREAGR